MTRWRSLTLFIRFILNGAIAIAVLQHKSQLPHGLAADNGLRHIGNGQQSYQDGARNRASLKNRYPVSNSHIGTRLSEGTPFLLKSSRQLLQGGTKGSSLVPEIAFVSRNHDKLISRERANPLFPGGNTQTSIYSTRDNGKRPNSGLESIEPPEDILMSGNYDLGIPPEDMEALRAVLDDIDPEDEGCEDEDQNHPLSDILFKYWGCEPDPRSKLLQLGERFNEESKKTNDLEEICKNMGLEAPIKVKRELAVAMVREMFNRRVRPKGYLERFMDELGISKLLQYLFPSKPDKMPSKWRFGIELKDPNVEIEPLSENALRGYLGVPYYTHIEELAKFNPEKARRILTIIHRIYTPPILYTDLHPDKEPTDQDLFNDSENLKKAQCNIYKKFIDTYPDLKWPVDDEGFLDIYNLWYPEDKADHANTLPELMKETYGPGSDLATPNFHYRFIAIPAISCTAGLATGTLLHRGISMLAGLIGGINAQLMVENVLHPKMCSAAVALLTWAGMSRDMTVKGDIFSVAIKNLVDNGMEGPQPLVSAVYSGLIPRNKIVEPLETFVIHCTLTAFQRAMRLSREGKGIDTWNLLAKQVRRVAEVCLPICGVSVYRIMHFVACDLATSDDLPCAEGEEVLGSDISGDKEDPHDDYSNLYKESNARIGLPQPNRELYERNAMLFTTFCLQAFSGMKSFKRVSDEDINKAEVFRQNMKDMNVPDEAWDNLRDKPIMPSTLDDVEKFARELEQNNGKLKRITLEREYGFDPMNDFLGESEQEKATRMQIELQEARDAVTDIATPKGYKLEMLKAISIMMYLREEWLLPRYKDFLKKQCTEFIATEVENMAGNLDEKIQEFNISPKYNEEIKTDAIFLVAQRMFDAGTLDYDKIIQMAQAANIPKEVALDACNIATFTNLSEELAKWDLTTVTPEMINEVKERYRCKDLVFVNAISEIIKKTSSEAKKEMINSRNKMNWNLVEKHMSALLRGRNAVINAAASTIDSKLWYRLERAFRYNRPFIEHAFTRDEIIGTGPVARIANADWEQVDPPPKKSDLEIAKEEFEASINNIKPIQIEGEDNETPAYRQMEISRLVEKGELDPEFECLPTEFHAGERPREREYELEDDPPKDKFELQRPIMNSKYAYACWVVYCYRKRAATQDDIKTVLTIFPFLEKLVERSDIDWRRLYARQRLRQKDSLGSKVDWLSELDCDKETAARVCGIAYEEDLLKRTGAFVEHIEDDIGDVEDSYFNPFDPSIYNRMNYLYSEKIPSELEMENVKKIQQFFSLSPEQIQEIHTKCFSFALGQHCANVMKESPKDWITAIEKELKPVAKRICFGEKPFEMILRKAEYDYLFVEANKLMMQRTPGRDFMERAEYIIEEFKRLRVLDMSSGKPKLRFSIRAQTEGVMEEIMRAFIVSHCDLYGKMDQTKLDEMCAIYGLFGERRKEMLNRIGRKFYHRFLGKFTDEEITMDCLKEVEHLHKTFDFEPKDVERVFNTHVCARIKEWYDPESGLDALKRLVVVLHGEDINRFIPFERSRRIQWFINIINDCINHGEKKAQTTLFTYPPDEFFDLRFEGGEENFDSLQGIINLATRVLRLTPEELRETRIIIGEELGGESLQKILHHLKGKDGFYVADEEMSRCIRALSVAPPDTMSIVKKELPPIQDYEPLRRLVMMLPCSDATLDRGIKIIDALQQA